MRFVKKELCKKGLLLFLLLIVKVNAATIWVSLGVYDFTDDISKEFYKYGQSFRVSCDFGQISALKLSATTGGSFSNVPYHGDDHEMFILPLLLSWKYFLWSEQSKIYPVIGSGAGIYAKMDHNEYFPKKRYSFTYGYHFTSGLNYKISNRLTSKFEMRYNILISPGTEDINSSGFDVLLGIGFLF